MKCEDCKWFGNCIVRGTVCQNYVRVDGSISPVNHPKHYDGKYECIEVMRDVFGEDAVKSFCKCNAYKYRFRSSRKNGEEDIKKAEWYETKLIELEGADA